MTLTHRTGIVLALTVVLAGPAGGREDTRLHDAAARGNLTEVRRLLAGGADVNGRDDKARTPLIRAAEEGRVDVARALVAAGADLDARDSAGNNALAAATRRKRTEIVALLDEEQAWRTAVATGTIDGYRTFTSSYSTSPHTARAASQLARLIEDADLDAARTANTLAAWETFAANHPANTVGRATVIVLRDWEAAMADDTIEAFEAFLGKHATSAFAPVAETRLKELTFDEDLERVRAGARRNNVDSKRLSIPVFTFLPARGESSLVGKGAGGRYYRVAASGTRDEPGGKDIYKLSKTRANEGVVMFASLEDLANNKTGSVINQLVAELRKARGLTSEAALWVDTADPRLLATPNIPKATSVAQLVQQVAYPTPGLVELLKNGDLATRRLAASALGIASDAVAAEALVATLADKDPQIRAAVVAALEAANEPVVWPALNRGLQSANLLVREGSRDVLRRLAGPAYTAASKAETPEALEAFVARYPTSGEAAVGRERAAGLRRDLPAWLAAQKSGRIAVYKEFLAAHPKSPYAAKAKAVIDDRNRYSEEDLYIYAVEQDWYSDFEHYLKRFPNGARADAARARLATLRSQTAKVVIEHPEFVDDSPSPYRNVGRPFWPWKTTLRETTGTMKVRIKGDSGYILDPRGGKWVMSTARRSDSLTRPMLDVPAGGSQSDDHWQASSSHQLCNGVYVMRWRGEDAGGHTIQIEERVRLVHKNCPGPKGGHHH